MFADFSNTLHELNIFSIIVRLLLALLCGGLIGWERERKSSAAGFKTYILVCLGSVLVMLTGQYLFKEFQSGDIARLGAQVISGIGFLGAGSIIVTGTNQIRGLTTAAGLWVVACLGLAIGSGFYAGAIAAMGILAILLTVLEKIEKKYIRDTKNRNLYIMLQSMDTIGVILTLLKESNLTVNDMHITNGKKKDSDIVLLLSIQASKELHSADILTMIQQLDGVEYIEEY